MRGGLVALALMLGVPPALAGWGAVQVASWGGVRLGAALAALVGPGATATHAPEPMFVAPDPEALVARAQARSRDPELSDTAVRRTGRRAPDRVVPARGIRVRAGTVLRLYRFPVKQIMSVGDGV